MQNAMKSPSSHNEILDEFSHESTILLIHGNIVMLHEQNEIHRMLPKGQF
jgi:hypothetical protein